MNAVCPNCRKAISWWKLRSEFACPHCATPLSAKTAGAFIATVVLWILADIPVKLYLFETFGTESLTGLFARVLVSGAVGWGLAFFIVAASVPLRHVVLRKPPAQSNNAFENGRSQARLRALARAVQRER